MLIDAFNKVIAKSQEGHDPGTVSSDAEIDEYNKIIDGYKTALKDASIEEILFILKHKLFMSSLNSVWSSMHVDLTIITYQQFFTKLEVPLVLSELARYMTLYGDDYIDISKEINKVVDFMETGGGWL